MSNNLIIWANFLKDDRTIESGIPTLRDIAISEQFNPKKPFPDFNYPWIEETEKLPKEVFVSIKNIKKLASIFIFSFKFLYFVRKFISFYKKTWSYTRILIFSRSPYKLQGS